jgi:hypothetical protein
VRGHDHRKGRPVPVYRDRFVTPRQCEKHLCGQDRYRKQEERQRGAERDFE